MLYDIQHFALRDIIERRVKQIEQEHEIGIDINIVEGYELLDRLRTNPNYNFVILHMGTAGEGAYRQADIARKLSSAILVAESAMHPHGQSEVLQYFDEYIGLISNEKANLINLLRKYAFISGKK